MQVSPQQTVTGLTNLKRIPTPIEGRITIFGRRHGRITSRDQSFTLAALASCSVEDKATRRTNLIARIAELERLAKAEGKAAMLVSIACPSRMCRLKWVDGESRANPEWNGTMPREAAAYLSRVWFRARASFARNGVDICGIYVQEPGRDGTPHLQCLVFYTQENGPAVRSTIRHFALDIDDINTAAQHARVQFDQINARPPLLAGYVAKYFMASQADGEVRA